MLDGANFNMTIFLASFTRSSGIRQKLQNAKKIHLLEEQTPKKIKKFIAKN
jgi:hypothetical protein